MGRALALVLFGVVLTAVGVAGGWLAARRAGPDGPAAGVSAADPGGPPTLSPQALKNLGVEVAPVTPTTWMRTTEIQAEIADRPENERPVTAPLGGVVIAVHVGTGQRVEADAPVATIARDPIQRPKPELTADLLLPISERVHEAAAALRAARQRRAIAERELARLRGFGETDDDLPVVSRSKIIEVEYEQERAELALTNAEHELERHGLTQGEIDAVAGGAATPPNPRLWARVLRENGLWNEGSDRIRATLAEEERDLPWAVAAIGELTAAGIAGEPLATMLEETPAAARRFAATAGLLLGGLPVETVGLLARQGALEPEMVVRAPAAPPADWDVRSLGVRAGQRVAPGDVLATLHDARRMWLSVEPVGAEVATVIRAVAERIGGQAEPLVEGAGPRLADVVLERLRTRPEGGGAVAYATLSNAPVGDAASGGARSWQLRKGTRYLLHLPAERLEGRIVLPAAAITSAGAETVVYVRDGASFREVSVHVERRDAKQVVIAADGSLFPGDPVVVRGAYALGLALQDRSGAAAQGHGHAHD